MKKLNSIYLTMTNHVRWRVDRSNKMSYKILENKAVKAGSAREGNVHAFKTDICHVVNGAAYGEWRPIRQPPHMIEETGVATVYETTKKISCAEMEWHVGWSSNGRNEAINGRISVSIDGKDKILAEAQDQLFGKFRSIDGISATCNPGHNGRPTSSVLLASGYAPDGSKKILGQVGVDRDFIANWSVSATD